MKSRVFDRLVIAFVIIVCLLGSWWAWTIHHVVRPWKLVAREDTEERVIALLGTPDFEVARQDKEIIRESVDREDGFTTAGRAIAKDFLYHSSFYGQYSVAFDSANRVVAKGHPPFTFFQ